METTGNVSKAANLWKLLDVYDDINFAAILGTYVVTLGYPGIQFPIKVSDKISN